MAPLPAGTYVARVVAGELSSARTGTPAYKLTFRVVEGEHADRKFWHDVWLTPAAMPMAKRDLGKLGVTSLEQLERPLPPGIRCRVQLALRREDDGRTHNRVRQFEVLGVDGVADDDFPPPEAGGLVPVPDPGGGPTGGGRAVPAVVPTVGGQMDLVPAPDKSLRPWEVNA